MNVRAIIIVILVLMGAVGTFMWNGAILVNYREEKEFRSLFLQIRDVESMKGFLSYEGHRSAQINIKGNRVLQFAGFDRASFVDTDAIDLSAIGNINISCDCREDSDDCGIGAMNIVRVMNSSSDVKIRSMGDLVANYDAIYAHLHQNFPERSENAKKVQVEGYWCSIITKPDTHPSRRST